MKNTFLHEMQLRGYLNQCTDIARLNEISSKKSISAYGFDCMQVVCMLKLVK